MKRSLAVLTLAAVVALALCLVGCGNAVNAEKPDYESSAWKTAGISEETYNDWYDFTVKHLDKNESVADALDKFLAYMIRTYPNVSKAVNDEVNSWSFEDYSPEFTMEQYAKTCLEELKKSV